MSWSKITKVFQGSLTGGTGNAVTTDEVEPQRIRDELGSLHASFNMNPGATTGTLDLQAKLREDQPFAPVFSGGSQVQLNMNTLNVLFATALTGVPMLPRIRFDSAAITPSATRMLTLHVIE